MIKGVRSIAEYKIREWLEDKEFELGCFDLWMAGNVGTVTDRCGETLKLFYNGVTKEVLMAEKDEPQAGGAVRDSGN